MDNESVELTGTIKAEEQNSASATEIEAAERAQRARRVRKMLGPLGLIIAGFAGMFVGSIVAVGQIFSIGFHAAWKIYKYWWMASPLLGIAFLLVSFTPIGIIEGIGWLIRHTVSPKYRKGVRTFVAIGSILGVIFAVGYFGARTDNPMLSSQPVNLEALTKTVGDQNRVLSELSESGKILLGQLNATETDLENAKRRLSITLSNFDAQRQAAGQVTEELNRIDTRQKQIALQTEELERILEGQKPITRQDLQRANWQGLVSGLILGFVTSFLASMAYNALGKRKGRISNP
jgi:hypothetical protein